MMTAPASRSRATAPDTALCGRPVRVTISPIALPGCARTSLTTIRTVRTLVDGLDFANGLVVDDDELRIAVAESGSFRLGLHGERGGEGPS